MGIVIVGAIIDAGVTKSGRNLCGMNLLEAYKGIGSYKKNLISLTRACILNY
jgi:hypothetical protein